MLAGQRRRKLQVYLKASHYLIQLLGLQEHPQQSLLSLVITHNQGVCVRLRFTAQPSPRLMLVIRSRTQAARKTRKQSRKASAWHHSLQTTNPRGSQRQQFTPSLAQSCCLAAPASQRTCRNPPQHTLTHALSQHAESSAAFRDKQMPATYTSVICPD